MFARTPDEIQKIYDNVETWKKLSDRVVGIGPFGIGLDGILTWIPGVGGIYSVAAGGWLLIQGLRARASPATLLRMAAYVAVDSVTSELFLVGDAVDFFFPGHLMAAKALQKDIESTHFVDASWREAKRSGEWERHRDEMRSIKGKRRLVFLRD